jgi:hypothetical protein
MRELLRLINPTMEIYTVMIVKDSAGSSLEIKLAGGDHMEPT